MVGRVWESVDSKLEEDEEVVEALVDPWDRSRSREQAAVEAQRRAAGELSIVAALDWARVVMMGSQDVKHTDAELAEGPFCAFGRRG